MTIRTRKSIIYHIPKTGGIWVKVAVRESGIQRWGTRQVAVSQPFNLKKAHATPDVVLPRHKQGRYGITFVRKPVDWYISYWSFRSRKGARRDEKFPADGLWSDDFDQFVNNVLDAYPNGFVTALYQYYTGENCEKVDFIGRQEHLADDLVEALTRAGEVFDEEALRSTPRQNESPDEWKEKCALLPETQARVAECERWVLETFYPEEAEAEELAEAEPASEPDSEEDGGADEGSVGPDSEQE